MSQPSRKPIRLTHQRAEALLAVASHGVELWERRIREMVADTADLDTVRAAKALDTVRARALDAMAIVQHRYLDGDVPTEPTPTLFDL